MPLGRNPPHGRHVRPLGLPARPCERETRVNTGPRTERLVMSVVRRHRVIIFFLLACALSWGAVPWNSFFAPGVLVAALIVVSVTEGVAGLRPWARG